LTKRIVEAQGGRVGVESVPGQGSMFFAVLPRTGVITGASAESPAWSGPAASGNILVVEDRPEEQRLLTQILNGAGHSVVIAANGAQAIRCARERRFDAITLDILL